MQDIIRQMAHAPSCLPAGGWKPSGYDVEASSRRLAAPAQAASGAFYLVASVL